MRMRHRRRASLAVRCKALLLAVIALPLCAGGALHIRLATDRPGEARARVQLQRLVADNDVQGWIFTRDIEIRTGAIPHSHPLLTLNARHLEDDRAQLATFLHEQFHWYVESRGTDVDKAIADFARRYPDAPFGGDDGGDSRDSTYLHLIVCDMELQAMTQLIGASDAQALLRRSDHYTWIYERLLDDPEVHRINVRYGLTIPPR